MSTELTIDARGMRCPWPALRLARALRQHPDAAITLLADDPAAQRECTAAAEAVGRVLTTEAGGAFRVAAPARVNTLFTDVP